MKLSQMPGALTFAALVCLKGVSGCSPNAGVEGTPAPGALRDASVSGMGGSTNGSPGTSGGSAISGGFNLAPGTGGQSTIGADASCAAFSQEPEQLIVYRDATVTDTVYDTVTDTVTDTITTYEPVALYIMMDRSSSMVGVAGDPTSWPNALAALTDFVSDPQSAGLDVGLGVFPDMSINQGCGDPANACCTTGTVCGPPVVDIAPLPGNGPNLIQGMQAANPANAGVILLTPTECALHGMVDHCLQHRSATGEQCVAILVTDGSPTLCNGDPTSLTNIVAQGLSNGVITFTLGLPGANIQFLNQLAQAGGSDCDPNGPNFACDLTSGSAGLIDTLNTIRSTVTSTVSTPVVSRVASTVSSQVTTQTVVSTPLDCQWGIPAPPEGQEFDPGLVNLRVTEQNGTASSFGYLESPDECALTTGGWYYDNPADPSQVVVCPNTCETLTALAGARVDILFGCETEPAKFQ